VCSRLKIPVYARLFSFTLVFDDLHAKTYHPEGCFSKNKPNSPNVQMNVTNLSTMIYTIFTSLTKVKNKPNQTQFKANSNPIVKRPKMNINIYHTKAYNNKTAFRRQKNKPNTKPNKANNQSSLINNQLIKGTVEVVSLQCKIDDLERHSIRVVESSLFY